MNRYNSPVHDNLPKMKNWNSMEKKIWDLIKHLVGISNNKQIIKILKNMNKIYSNNCMNVNNVEENLL